MSTYKIAVSSIELDHKIPAGDPLWSTFNASFRNVDYEPLDIAGAVYSGFSITTQHKNNWRHSNNYVCGQHIGLDFDHGGQTIEKLMKDPIIAKYSSFLYSTMSHTEEEPRTRVIFLLDTPIMQAQNYAMAATALLWLFGEADRACKDAARFFYGSPWCKMENPGNVLPLEKVKHIIQQYQETGMREKKRSSFTAPADMQEVQSALDKIPPMGIDYTEWLSVLMGIHSQFGAAGLPMADAWGQGKEGEIERKFKTFDAGGNVTGAVSIATVFGLAKKFGWSKHA